MPVKGPGSASGPKRRPKPKPRPRPKPTTVFDRLGRQSGPVTTQTPAKRAPQRKTTLPVRAPRGDAPQTRKQDARKAERYNRSERGRASRRVAQRAEEKRQIRAALNAVRQASDRRAKAPGPSLPKRALGTVDRELSGRGKIVPALSSLARELAKQSTSNPYGSNVQKSGIGIQGEMNKTTRRGVEDLFNLPASAVTGTYVYGRAAAKAAAGDTREAKDVLKGIQRDDPVYALVTGEPKRALKLAGEHPGFAAAEVFGIGKGLDRGAGRTVRGAGRVVKGAGKATRSKKLQAKGEKIRRVAATETREDAVVPGTNMRVSRRYDRGLATKAAQARRDRRKSKQARDLRQRADNLENQHGKVDDATELRRQAAKVDPTVAKPGHIRRAVDVYEAASESNRRRRMTEADEAVTAVTKGEKGAGLNLIAQGIVRADPEDLKAYRRELEAAHPNLDSPAKKKANEQTRRLIDESLDREAKKPGALKQTAERARRYSAEVDQPLDRVLGDMGLIDRDQAARVKVQAYAARRLGAKYDDKAKKWVNRDGDPLDYMAVARQMAKEPDAVPPSYVSQAPNATGAGAYYRSSYEEPRYTGGKGRTEKATREGTFDASPETMRARATKAANVIAAAENYRGFLKEFGVRKPGEKNPVQLGSSKQAREHAQKLSDQTGVDYRAVRTAPWSVSREQFAEMLDSLGDEADARSFKAFKEQIDAGLKGEGDGPFAIISESAARQLEQHMRVLNPSDAGKLAQAARASFSRTVLSLSPSPTIGNAAEGGFRALVSRSGPTSAVTYRRVMNRLREVDPDAAKRLEDRTLGTGRVTLQTSRRHTEPGQFDDGAARKLAARAGQIRRAPGGKTASALWDHWTNFVFDTVNNKLIERPAQKVMMGKAIRDSGLMNDGMLNVSRTAVDQAAQGLRGTAEQIRMADDLRDMYGQYRSFGPTQRKTIANYTPFLAWYLNAARFVGQVLPRDHPTLLAVMASAAQVTDDVDIQKARPAWLKGTLDAGGVKWQATRNTPFGAFTDPLGTASGLILPQLSAFIDAGRGEDFTGRKLQNEDDTSYSADQLLGHALWETAKSSIPLVAVADRQGKYRENPGSLLNAVRVNEKGEKRQAQSPQVKATKKPAARRPVSRDPLAELDRIVGAPAGGDDLERQLRELDKVVK